MPAVTGLLSLMGIVSKNPVLLVEYAIEARRHGMAVVGGGQVGQAQRHPKCGNSVESLSGR